jgi:hypothetical protein
MFEPGTILALKDPQSTEEETYPYDRVLVVGQSPVHHATESGSAFAGADAQGYIIRPVEGFAGTVDKPVGLLNELYEIESYPTDPTTGEPLRPENNPRNLPTPEQLLRRAAEENPAPAKPRGHLPSLQDDVRSPEQVLRAAGEQPKKRGPGRPKKETT